MFKLVSFVMTDILRNKLLLVYTTLLFFLSISLFYLQDNSSKAILTLLNLILLIVPLVSILFSTIYVYNSAEFIELMVSQPIKRSKIWISLYWGLSISLVIAYLIGTGLVLLLFDSGISGIYLLVTGIFITLIFTSLAFFATVIYKDKAKGIGLSLMIWLFFSVIFDSLLLFAMFQLSAYPIEGPMVILTVLSPLDLARIINLQQLEASAMLGYIGALFNKVFYENSGLLISAIAFIIWIAVPFLLSLKIFSRKDL